MSELAQKLIAENKAKHARGEDARVLDLGNCGLIEVPEEVGELVWLEEVSFHYNPFLRNGVYPENQGRNNITKLSANFIKLQNLRKLDISGDTSLNNDHSFDLSDITLLSSLLNLRHLDITDTCVYNLNPLSELKNLEYLAFSYTGVSDLTPLKNLTNLKHIVFYYTNVKDLAPIISMIKNGLKITSQNPSLIHPPPEIVKQGNAAILQYFEEQEKQQFKNTEIKLILLGNSTAGKTTLSRYLREKIYTPHQSTTHGIQNYCWESPGGRDIQVNIWDFGGQEYYHATHRLYLSRNAVYSLVWDAKTDKGGFEPTQIHYDNDPDPHTVQLEHFPLAWWVKNVRHFTHGSNPPVPILLVQNKSARDDIKRVPEAFEKPPFDLLPAWLDNHIDIASTAAHFANPQPQTQKWQRSWEAFEERLLDKLESQLTHYEFAIYHRDIRDRVRALASGENPTNEMSWTDFETMCRAIEPDAKMDLVQIYLRDIMGDILYFDQNERLRHRVFLRPEWVCNCIYAILSRKVLEYEGLFDLGWVQEVLQCDELEALDFVELMRMFELIFPDSDESGKPNGYYVAPQYLPELCRKAEYLQGLQEDNILTHAFTLWFPDFLPKSHFARFISNWGEQAEGRIFWKNGLLCKIDNLKVLIVRSDEFKIRVDIQTGDKLGRQDAMRRVLASFLDLEGGKVSWETADGEPWMTGDGGFWQFGENVEFAVSMDEENYAFWDDIYQAVYMNVSHVKSAIEKQGKLVDIQQYKFLFPKNRDKMKIFISYSKSDKEYLETAKKHLKLFERQGKLQVWDDTQLIVGEEWDAAIKRELATADIILFLVSSDLIATDYVWDIEMKRALERAASGEVAIIPVIIRACVWESAPFGKFNALPAKGTPISSFDDEDEAWKEVVQKIGAIIQ